MTGHLTPDEQIDSLEGTLGPDRAAHLDVCGTCRDDVARLRETFDAARRVDVPEPSPLFWQHQAARISELVAGESIQRPRSAWTYAAWAGSAAAVAAAGLLFLRTASTPVPSSLAVGLQARDASPALSEPASRDDADERAWSVVEDLGGEIDGDAGDRGADAGNGRRRPRARGPRQRRAGGARSRVAARVEAENRMMRVGAAILFADDALCPDVGAAGRAPGSRAACRRVRCSGCSMPTC